jgi:hypothetical protein
VPGVRPRDYGGAVSDTAEHDQMRDLFNRAMDTGPAIAALDRLVYCYIVDRLTNGDTITALDVFADDGTSEAATRELDALDDQGRADLAAKVIPLWNTALSLAVLHLWHTCRRLGFDPESLDPKHIALVASVFLGDQFTHLADQLETA